MSAGQSDRHNQICACQNNTNRVFVPVNDCDRTLISRLGCTKGPSCFLIIGMALPSTYNMAQAVQDYLQLCNIFQYHILNLTSRINNSYFSNKRWVEGLKLFISVSPLYFLLQKSFVYVEI
jgi:hypothetical protein